MKKVKQSLKYVLMGVFMVSFSQCSSTKKLQTVAPVSVGEVYCQDWVAGIQGGGAGLNIFIPTTDKSVTFEQVYFRGKVTTLEVREGLYIGRFKSNVNLREEILLSDTNSKVKEKATKEVADKIPFTLENNQCVVSYKEGDKTKYFKIDNVTQKQSIAYPSAGPQQGIDNININKNL